MWYDTTKSERRRVLYTVKSLIRALKGEAKSVSLEVFMMCDGLMVSSRTVNVARYDSSSLLTGLNKECLTVARVSLSLSARYTRPRNSSDTRDRSSFTAGRITDRCSVAAVDYLANTSFNHWWTVCESQIILQSTLQARRHPSGAWGHLWPAFQICSFSFKT